jgi:hypothetical protein
LNQVLLLLNLHARLSKPSENGTLALYVHSMVVNLLQNFRNQGQWEGSHRVMKATHKIEEPLLCPNSFAGVMLSAERFVVEVRWERGMVSKTPPFHCNRFLGCRNYHVDVIVQPL